MCNVTYQELVTTITKLPVEQRLSLLEVLAQSLRADLPSRTAQTSSLDRVRGILRPNGPPPSDQELADSYTDHLLEKYG